MERKLDDILDECLDGILLRGESVEQCLQRYPSHAQELEPLLRLALRVRTTTYLPLEESRKAAGKERLLQALKEQEQSAHRAWPTRGWFSGLMEGYRRWAVTGAAVIFLLLGAAGGTAAASVRSMPDSALYPLKTFTEDVELAFTFGTVNKAKLYAKLSERRAKEIEHLARRGKYQRIPGVQITLQRHLQTIERLNLETLDKTLKSRKVPGPPLAFLTQLQATPPLANASTPAPSPRTPQEATTPALALPPAVPPASKPESSPEKAPKDATTLVPDSPAVFAPAPTLLPPVPLVPPTATPRVPPIQGPALKRSPERKAAIDALREHRKKVRDIRIRLERRGGEHLVRLERLRALAPDRNKPALTRAIEALRSRYQRAILSAGGLAPEGLLEEEGNQDQEN